MPRAKEVHAYSTYCYIPDEDCPTAHHHAGKDVVALAVYQGNTCLDCWWVRAVKGDSEFWVFASELHDVETASAGNS